MSEYRHKHLFVVEQYRQVGTAMTIQLRCSRLHRGALERCSRRKYILAVPGQEPKEGHGIVPFAHLFKETA